MKSIFVLFLTLGTLVSVAANQQSSEPRARTIIDFDNHLVEGQNQISNYGLVEGETEAGDTGVVELRENFIDKLSKDAGEPIR